MDAPPSSTSPSSTSFSTTYRALIIAGDPFTLEEVLKDLAADAAFDRTTLARTQVRAPPLTTPPAAIRRFTHAGDRAYATQATPGPANNSRNARAAPPPLAAPLEGDALAEALELLNPLPPYILKSHPPRGANGLLALEHLDRETKQLALFACCSWCHSPSSFDVKNGTGWHTEATCNIKKQGLPRGFKSHKHII